MSARDRWSLRNIYLYLVCLITLIMVIVATVGVVRSGVELAYPSPGYGPVAAPRPAGAAASGPSAAESDLQKQQERRYAVLNLVGNVAMLLVAGPVYVYHWRRIEREIAEYDSVTLAAS